MAWFSRRGSNFPVLEDEDGNSSTTYTLSPSDHGSEHGCENTGNHLDLPVSHQTLRQIGPNFKPGFSDHANFQTRNRACRTADSLADKLRKLRIVDKDETEDEKAIRGNQTVLNSHSNKFGSICRIDDQLPQLQQQHFDSLPSTHSPKSRGRGLRNRPVIEVNTFDAPDIIEKENEDINLTLPLSPISAMSLSTIKVSNSKTILQEALAANFTRAQQVRKALDNKFDIILRIPVDTSSCRYICYGCTILPRSQKNFNHNTYSVIGRPIEDPKLYDQGPPTSPHARKPSNTFFIKHSSSPKMITRIEDSLEAIDKLEEQLESFDAVTSLRRVISPEVKPPVKANRPASLALNFPHASFSIKEPPAQNISAWKESSKSVRSSRFSTLNPTKLQAVKRETSDFGSEDRTKTVVRRASIARIISLAEPKSRSSKPLRVPSVEFSRSTVSRKIREQCDMHHNKMKNIDSGSVRSTTVIGGIKSSKPLGRPNLEVSENSIFSKRREEGKMKTQEEERRDTRIRVVNTPNSHSYLNETVASGARHYTRSGAMPETTPNKRLSVPVRTPTSAGTTSSISPRGRSSVVGSPTTYVNRAASTSTGSVSRKRSTIMVEDQQRIQGKEIYARDNKYSEDKEQERRERELTAKLARQQAAERSRQASREWAEKQRQRKNITSSVRSTVTSRAAVL